MGPTNRRALALDIVLGVAVAVAITGISANIEPAPGERHLDALGYATTIGAGLALALRRRFPRAVLAVLTVALVVYTRRLYAGGPIYLTMAVPLYTLALQAERRRDAIVPTLAAVGVLTAFGTIAMDQIEWTWHVAVFPGWAAASLFLGDAARSRRQYLSGLEERARYLEETREEEARRRVAEERLRIARDLHDVIAHSIATINLQSGVAAHVLERRPEQAGEALDAIKRTSGAALHELKATLDVLRGDADETQPRSPIPGLDRVDDLATTAAHAGLPVHVRWDGRPAALPAAVDTAGYRIVQESITNVMRHAHATTATVAIRCTPDAVDIEVVDDGRGAGATAAGRNGEGHGIAGMRERAGLVGGTLEAGPNPGGGYRVRAHLPIGDGR